MTRMTRIEFIGDLGNISSFFFHRRERRVRREEDKLNFSFLSVLCGLCGKSQDHEIKHQGAIMRKRSLLVIGIVALSHGLCLQSVASAACRVKTEAVTAKV